MFRSKVYTIYYSLGSFIFNMVDNGWRYENVMGFGVLLYQNTPKLDASLKAK